MSEITWRERAEKYFDKATTGIAVRHGQMDLPGLDREINEQLAIAQLCATLAQAEAQEQITKKLGQIAGTLAWLAETTNTPE